MSRDVHISERAAGLTAYYFAGKLAEIRRRMAEGQDIINLGVGSPDLAPAEGVVDAVRRGAGEEGAFRYQPYRGIPALTAAMADHLRRDFGVEVPVEGIVPLLGSKEACGFLSLAHLDSGDAALVPDPGYPTYTSATRLAGGHPVPYALTEAKGHHPEPAALEALTAASEAQGHPVRLLWLNYPHMPTGKAPDPDRLTAVVAWAKARGILVVHDNPYARILNSGTPFSLLSLPGAEGAVELHSLSKGHRMAGARIGFAVGTPEAVAPMFRIASQFASGMWRPLQEAAVEALTHNDGIDEANVEYAARQAAGRALLEALGCTVRPGQVGMFLWARVPAGWTGDTLSDALLDRAHVFLTPGQVFGRQGDLHLRLSLCTPLDRIREAHQRIESVALSPS